MIELNECEKLLLRKGNILTPIGIFRAIMCNDYQITRDHFIELVKINWNQKNLTPRQYIKIDKYWEALRSFLEDLDVVIEFSDDKIVIEDITDKFIKGLNELSMNYKGGKK